MPHPQGHVHSAALVGFYGQNQRRDHTTTDQRAGTSHGCGHQGPTSHDGRIDSDSSHCHCADTSHNHDNGTSHTRRSHRNHHGHRSRYSSEDKRYKSLSKSDLKLLTAILRDFPIELTKTPNQVNQYWGNVGRLINKLPVHLQSTSTQRYAQHQVTSNGRVAPGALCSEHMGLKPEIILSLYNTFRKSLEKQLGPFTYPLIMYAGLGSTIEHRVRQLEPIAEMWNREYNSRLDTPVGREPILSEYVIPSADSVAKFGYQTNECAACILARIGSDEKVCFALFAVMVGAYRRSAIGPRKNIRSRRVLMAKYWLKNLHADKEKGILGKLRRRSKIIDEAWEMGIELKRVSRAFKDYVAEQGMPKRFWRSPQGQREWEQRHEAVLGANVFENGMRMLSLQESTQGHEEERLERWWDSGVGVDTSETSPYLADQNYTEQSGQHDRLSKEQDRRRDSDTVPGVNIVPPYRHGPVRTVTMRRRSSGSGVDVTMSEPSSSSFVDPPTDCSPVPSSSSSYSQISSRQDDDWEMSSSADGTTLGSEAPPIVPSEYRNQPLEAWVHQDHHKAFSFSPVQPPPDLPPPQYSRLQQVGHHPQTVSMRNHDNDTSSDTKPETMTEGMYQQPQSNLDRNCTEVTFPSMKPLPLVPCRSAHTRASGTRPDPAHYAPPPRSPTAMPNPFDPSSVGDQQSLYGIGNPRPGRGSIYSAYTGNDLTRSEQTDSPSLLDAVPRFFLKGEDGELHVDAAAIRKALAPSDLSSVYSGSERSMRSQELGRR